MKITRRQLRNIIKENLSEEDTVNMSASVPNREDVTFNLKIHPSKSGEKTKVDASFSDEEGNSRELSNSKEDQLKLLGALRSALDTAKDETKEIVLRAIAIITGESPDPRDLTKLASKVKTDRSLASAAQHVQDKNTPLTT